MVELVKLVEMVEMVELVKLVEMVEMVELVISSQSVKTQYIASALFLTCTSRRSPGFPGFN